MKDVLNITGVSVRPGEKISCYVTVPDTDYRFPVTIINGARDGRILLATAGIHGCEYPGVLTVVELAKEIDPAQVNGAIIMTHEINMSAFLERQTYVVPADEERKNLNRMFPTDHSGTLADKICVFLGEALVRPSDFHIDIHSGDMVEDLEACILVANTPDPGIQAICTEAAQRTRFQWRMNSGGRTEFYNSSAINYGIPALLFERGGHGECLRKDVEDNKADLVSIMQYLGILSGTPEINHDQHFFDRHEWTEAIEGDNGLLFSFVKVGDDIREGQKLFEIRDMFGDLIREIHACFDGHVVIMSNTLAVHEHDDLITYGHIGE